MTITTSQLDELETDVRSTPAGADFNIDPADLLQLVAIARAALAYTRPVETEQDARDKEIARRALMAALRGAP